MALGINLRMKIIQELILCRVVIGSLNRTNPKRLTKKGKLTLKETTIDITPGVNQGQRKTKQNNIATRMCRIRGNNRTKTRGGEPRQALCRRNTMNFLEADNINIGKEESATTARDHAA